jgi:Domain of unknown function (DUF384)/Domain of unknown function (DUF383)
MLLANLSKSPSLARLVDLTRTLPAGHPPISTSRNAMDQLMDCFVKEAPSKAMNDYDYLSYVFADLSRHETGRKYFLTKQNYDQAVPITKVTFETASHGSLLSESGTNILPYVLLPLAGNEEFSDEDTDGMLADLQLLPPDKERDPDLDILVTHLETLLLLTTSREGRDIMRRVKVYPIIRDCHLHVENENVREACDRLVQVLLRDEAEEGKEADETEGKKIEVGQTQNQEDDEDEKIVEVF